MCIRDRFTLLHCILNFILSLLGTPINCIVYQFKIISSGLYSKEFLLIFEFWGTNFCPSVLHLVLCLFSFLLFNVDFSCDIHSCPFHFSFIISPLSVHVIFFIWDLFMPLTYHNYWVLSRYQKFFFVCSFLNFLL